MATPTQPSAAAPTPATTEKTATPTPARNMRAEREAAMTILEALEPFDAETQLRILASCYAMLDPRAARAAFSSATAQQKTEQRTANSNQRSNGNGSNARA